MLIDKRRQNKKAYITLGIILLLIMGLVMMMVVGVSVFVFDQVDAGFSEINFQLGNVSFNETYDSSLGFGLATMKTTFPKIVSLGTLLGMIIVLIMIGYFSPKIGRLWIALDFFVIIVAEMIAVVVSESFESFINSSPEFLAIYSTTLSGGSTFILTLPITVPMIGGLVMLATYILNKNFDNPERSLQDIPGETF